MLEFQVHVLDKKISWQINELHVLCEEGMCKYTITIHSHLCYRLTLDLCMHDDTLPSNYPVRSIEKKGHSAVLHVIIWQSLCVNQVSLSVLRIWVGYTVYAFCVWNIKMSKRLSCILLWKYGIFSKHFRLRLKNEWISIHLMTQIKSCIDPLQELCEFVHDTYLVLFDYRLLHSDGSELDKLLLGAVFLDNMNIMVFSTV